MSNIQALHGPPGTVGRTCRPSVEPSNGLDVGALFLTLAWITIVFFVDPRGEFSINDDWSFRRSLERLLFEGRLGSTGWGPDTARSGGPSLLTHLLWAALFVKGGGLSWLSLRTAVLASAILGSLALYSMLRRSGAGRRLSLIGTATVVFGPLFLSQSFTFMSDVTFASLLSLALLVLVQAVERESVRLLLLGQMLALFAILTRQLGLALPLGLVGLSFAHPKVEALGRYRVLLSTLGLVILPWIGFEYTLSISGSTPVTQHGVIHRLFERMGAGGIEPLLSLLGEVFHHELFYLGLLLVPVTLLLFAQVVGDAWFRQAFYCLSGAFICAELGAFFELIRVPVFLHRNVITAWGIGPVLLKDVYLLKVPRFSEIPQALWIFCVYLGLISTLILASRVLSISRRMWVRSNNEVSVLTALSLTSCVLYLGVIALSGFHDRYLIVPCLLLVCTLVGDNLKMNNLKALSGVGAALPCLSLAVFSVLGTRDFMEIKRAQLVAHRYVESTLGVGTCETDSGFEYNGYYCYRQDFVPKNPLSHWWVERERYVLTLGTLPGYRDVHKVPFERWLGTDGFVHVLEPVQASASGELLRPQ